MPNQAKKQRKKAAEVIQNVRIGRLLKSQRASLVAFAELLGVMSISIKNLRKTTYN